MNKIFILTLNHKNYSPNKIIIWADNEEEARTFSPSKSSVRAYDDFSKRDGFIEIPFQDPTQSDCHEMVHGEDYNEIIACEDSDYIKITNLKNGIIYTLNRRDPCDLDTGKRIDFLTRIEHCDLV